MTLEPSATVDVVTQDAFLKPFLGVFTLSEPIADVRKRVHGAIDGSIASLSWALRTVARPILRHAAHIPEWIRFEGSAAQLTVGFSAGLFGGDIALCSALDGARSAQRLVPGIQGEVMHARVNDRTLRTEIFSDSGKITNVYELIADDVIEGRVTMEGDEIPQPILYSMKLSRKS